MFLRSTVIVRKMKRKDRTTIDEGGRRAEVASDNIPSMRANFNEQPWAKPLVREMERDLKTDPELIPGPENVSPLLDISWAVSPTS